MILIAVGMFVISISLILSHFVALNDFAKGVCIGVGIGLLLISVIFGNFRQRTKD